MSIESEKIYLKNLLNTKLLLENGKAYFYWDKSRYRNIDTYLDEDYTAKLFKKLVDKGYLEEGAWVPDKTGIFANPFVFMYYPTNELSIKAFIEAY